MGSQWADDVEFKVNIPAGSVVVPDLKAAKEARRERERERSAPQRNEKLRAERINEEQLFRYFQQDAKALVLDLRKYEQFSRRHVRTAFNPILKDERRLVDQSKGGLWGKDCWWGRKVVCYSNSVEQAEKHAVVQFLEKEGRCLSLEVLEVTYQAFESSFPFLCTQSVKASALRRYPAAIIPGKLYLGDWEHAKDADGCLKDLNIRAMITIHNSPDLLKTPQGFKSGRHLRMELADTETEDIKALFTKSNAFIGECIARNERCLVHCGAGVSRSAALVCAYLVLTRKWSAAEAVEHTRECRPVAAPNRGFYKQLKDYSKSLGILQPPDPDDVYDGGAGADAPTAPSLLPPPSPDVDKGRKDARSPPDDAAGPPRRDGGGAQRSGHQPEPSVSRRESHGNSSVGVHVPKILFDVPSWAAPPKYSGWRLEVHKNGEQIAIVAVGQLPAYVFGRDPDCHVRLDHASVSRRHAAIVHDRRGQGQVVLMDLGSAHGTVVDGRRLGRGEQVVLKEGSKVRFGASTRSYMLSRGSKWEDDDDAQGRDVKRMRY